MPTPAKTAEDAKAATKKKVTFTRKKALVMQSYSIKDKKEGIPFYVEVKSNIKSKEQLTKAGKPDLDDDGKPKILHLCQVVDLETGESGEMVLPFMVHRALESIKHDDLVGMKFEFCKGKMKGRTNEWTVYEVE